MRAAAVTILLHWALLVVSEEAQTKDLMPEEPEELERGHRHRRRKQQQQQQAGPCGGYGRTFGFGEKLFSSPGYSNTYVSAPVMNYFIGCGPAAPVPAFPSFPAPQYPQPSFGHHHSHSHSHAHGGFGGPAFNQQPFPYQGGYNQPYQGYNQPYQSQGYNQPSFDQYQAYGQRPNRPVQMVVSAAASGLGTALADYISGGSRPKKAHKQVTKTVNQLFKPLYKLF